MADTDAASFVNCSVSAVLASAEEEQKCKYLFAAELYHASFTSFVEALMFLQHLGDRLLMLGIRVMVMY